MALEPGPRRALLGIRNCAVVLAAKPDVLDWSGEADFISVLAIGNVRQIVG